MEIELTGSAEDFARALIAVRGRREAEEILTAIAAHRLYGRLRPLTIEQLDEFDSTMAGQTDRSTWQRLAPIFRTAMALDAQVRDAMLAFVAFQRERLTQPTQTETEDTDSDTDSDSDEPQPTISPTRRRGRPPGSRRSITDPEILERRRVALAKARQVLAAKKAATNAEVAV